MNDQQKAIVEQLEAVVTTLNSAYAPDFDAVQINTVLARLHIICMAYEAVVTDGMPDTVFVFSRKETTPKTPAQGVEFFAKQAISSVQVLLGLVTNGTFSGKNKPFEQTLYLLYKDVFTLDNIFTARRFGYLLDHTGEYRIR